MTDIQQLDSRTVERIAAGEVVERPASVVKELVENAIDADASRIEVAVEDGGRGRIQVTDDGIGMSREAVQRAVEEHTTSKIADVSDLEAGVSTLGFRGEALHAIGAVARVIITTRPRGAEEGTELVVEGGEVADVGPAGCPAGTTVTVEDLFFNVPARRKYLKQATTEFTHVNRVVSSYALADPDLAVVLEHDGRETFATTGQGNQTETVMAVYGREVARSMRRVEAVDGDSERDGGDDVDGSGAATSDHTTALPDGPLDGVTGLVSHPETNRAGREYITTFVNGRYVRSGAIREAIVDAYGGQLAPDRYPFAVLFLDVDPGTVDVNVHPRKLEVRFADEAGVREQVEEAVETALLREGLVRSGAPRGKSAPEQTRIDPEQSVSEDDGEPSSGESTRQTAATDDSEPASSERSGSASAGQAGDGSANESAPASQSIGGSSADERRKASVDQRSDAGDDAGSQSQGDRRHGGQRHGGQRHGDRRHDGQRHRGRIRGDHDQARLGDEPAQEFESLPAMRLLGQYRETYVVVATDDGLALIDQHAADERINYERLRADFQGETTTQALAEPVSVELTAQEAAVFEERSDALAQLGFHASRSDERTVEVSTVPGVLADGAGPELVRDLLSSIVEGEASAAATVEAAADELLGDLACYPSITGNTSLTEGSIRELLAALDDCENPYACPHGRPVIVELDDDEIEARFERDYPGHGGRRT